MVTEFSKNLGVAFQILNDLKDWEGDSDNKMMVGQDVLAGRPTLLLALALEGLTGAEREELLGLLQPDVRETQAMTVGADHVARVRRLFERADVFIKAEKLIEKYRARAEAIADETEPTELRELLYFLVDTVLDRQPPPEPEVHALPLIQLST
jgi:geranylgeranyl pyrophosphate synthase